MIRPNLGYYHCSYSYLPVASLPSSVSKEQPAPCELSAEVEQCTVVPVVVGGRGGVTLSRLQLAVVSMEGMGHLCLAPGLS